MSASPTRKHCSSPLRLNTQSNLSECPKHRSHSRMRQLICAARRKAGKRSIRWAMRKKKSKLNTPDASRSISKTNISRLIPRSDDVTSLKLSFLYDWVKLLVVVYRKGL